MPPSPLVHGARAVRRCGALDHWASIVTEPEPVTTTVEEVTGRPVRTFHEWVRDHAADFR